ncbi:hypothetical protein J4526_03465 [Desulfurococcaceae archaeon MEX13E-LK6-19]|nr:hypothetical protein J4526_03465 [Desulfurococcaceae archaeon MEX13E-LK6-19]
MEKRRLVVLVYEPKRFRQVLDRLKKRRIPFSIPDDIKDIKPGDVVYTDDPRIAMELMEKGVLVFLDDKGSDSVLEKAILSLKFKNEYNELTVGVDPGDRFVVVVLADGSIVDFNISYSIEEALDYIRWVLKVFPAKKKIIKIGGGVGGIAFLDKLCKSLGLVVKETRTKIMVVDEGNSTPKTRWRNPFIERIISVIPDSIPYRKDLYAATAIALKQGVLVEDSDEDKPS